MMELLTHNLYRFFGVFVNSPKKEIETNKEKILTSIREKKTISFNLDLEGIMPPVEKRDNEEYVNIKYDLIKLLPIYQMFWFISKTPTDAIAFNHLYNGDINSAIDTWEKDKNMYSLHNLFVCYLIKEDYKTAILNCAIPLYEQYSNDIDYINDGTIIRLDKQTKIIGFINELVSGLKRYNYIDLTTIAKESKNDIFRYCLLNETLNEKIEKLITDAKNSRKKKGTRI